jgi:hypothetical protein
MSNSQRLAKAVVVIVTSCVFTACGQKAAAPTEAAPTPAAASPMKPIAGVQDIMADMIDPAADFLWESVSSTETAAGIEEKQPRTDGEWKAVRRQAIILTESANLLMMDGRHVAREGKALEDHGTPGNLTAAESQQAIDANRAQFIAFAQALHDVGATMLKATDDRNPQAMVDAGDTMDQVCEGCHLKFWYPGQKIPVFPGQAPEEK